MSSESNNNNSNEVKDYSGIDKKIFVVIPAYNTGAILLSVVRKTLQYAHHIVVINDGSDAENEHVFADLKEFPDVKLISHERNLGKGFALITGIKYCLGEMSDHDYLVTLDGDGQHDPENIQDFNALVARKGHVDFILGERRDDKQMPLKSRFGNTIARVLFKIQFGGKIHDTQSGFRMLSRGFCEKFIQSISPGRYETELDMLILALKNLKHVETVPISTIYFENNKRTSFQPFPDSYRVMRLFVKYGIVSIVSFLLDYLFFLLISFYLGSAYIYANIIARVFSASFNFLGHKIYSFGTKGMVLKEGFKYMMAVIIALALSSLLLYIFINVFGIVYYFAKPLADSTVFIINFITLNKFVFSKKDRS